MRDLLSHFQPTAKAALAFLIGFGTWLATTGPDVSTSRKLAVAFGAYTLSILVPKRDPGANAKPDAAPMDEDGPIPEKADPGGTVHTLGDTYREPGGKP